MNDRHLSSDEISRAAKGLTGNAAHLQSCEACRSEVAHEQSIRNLMQLSVKSASNDLTDQLFLKLDVPSVISSPRRAWSSARSLLILTLVSMVSAMAMIIISSSEAVAAPMTSGLPDSAVWSVTALGIIVTFSLWQPRDLAQR